MCFLGVNILSFILFYFYLFLFVATGLVVVILINIIPQIFAVYGFSHHRINKGFLVVVLVV